MDKNELKKKQIVEKKNESYIAENYCVQNGILLSKSQPLKEDMHLRENNDRVSYILSIVLNNFINLIP